MGFRLLISKFYQFQDYEITEVTVTMVSIFSHRSFINSVITAIIGYLAFRFPPSLIEVLSIHKCMLADGDFYFKFPSSLIEVLSILMMKMAGHCHFTCFRLLSSKFYQFTEITNFDVLMCLLFPSSHIEVLSILALFDHVLGILETVSVFSHRSFINSRSAPVDIKQKLHMFPSSHIEVLSIL